MCVRIEITGHTCIYMCTSTVDEGYGYMRSVMNLRWLSDKFVLFCFVLTEESYCFRGTCRLAF